MIVLPSVSEIPFNCTYNNEYMTRYIFFFSFLPITIIINLRYCLIAYYPSPLSYHVGKLFGPLFLKLLPLKPIKSIRLCRALTTRLSKSKDSQKKFSTLSSF